MTTEIRSRPNRTQRLTSERPLAILGAGPVGLEAALAAVEAGLPVTVVEAGAEVAAHMADWGHVQLFTPWSLSVSPRMRRRLVALDCPAPSGNECPTGHALRERVLLPIAADPLVAPHLRLHTRALAIARQGLLKDQEIGTEARGRPPFRILTQDGSGREDVIIAGAVLDCTGTWSQPNWMGDGGIPAPGEAEAAPFICRRIPNFEREAEAWAGRRILLVGAGHSAQTVARDLAALADHHRETRITWALRTSQPQFEAPSEDPLPVRRALAMAAEHLARGGSSALSVLPGVVVESMSNLGKSLRVSLRRDDGRLERLEVDKILALTGATGDASLYRQLQVHECYATSGPMKLAAALLGGDSADCLDQASHGVEALRSPEPDFFVLGIKSYGRNNSFLMRVGWEQVRDVIPALAGSA